MALPGKEEEKLEQGQERWGGVWAAAEEEEAPRDDLAERIARLAVGEREAGTAVAPSLAGEAAVARFRAEYAAVARFWEEGAAVAAGDHFFPPFLGHAHAPAQLPPPVGPAGEIGPVAPPPVGMPYRDVRRRREGHLRRGRVLSPRNEQGACMPPARSDAAGGVLPGDHAYMAAPRFLHRGPALINLLGDPELFLPEHEQAVLRALSEETSETVVSYACALMENRNAQRLFRLVLRLCDHELRECLVARITWNKEMFWRICGKRSDEVVFVIKNCGTRRSMLMLREAMLPWMIPTWTLMTDLNRLAVVQAFILSSPEDIAQTIFEAVAKNCSKLACQQNGLKLLQDCLCRVHPKERDEIYAEVSYMSFHLAQNNYGNFIVQEALQNRNPCHLAIIASRFRNNYVSLSKQKFSSHVVECCLEVFDVGQRSVIVNELIYYPHFRELVIDEFANFVISRALRTCNFPLRNMLGQAILSQNVNRRNPHCLKIFGILSKQGFMQ